MKKYILPALGGILVWFILLYVLTRLSDRQAPPPIPKSTEIPAPVRWTPDAEDWGKG